MMCQKCIEEHDERVISKAREEERKKVIEEAKKKLWEEGNFVGAIKILDSLTPTPDA